MGLTFVKDCEIAPNHLQIKEKGRVSSKNATKKERKSQ